MRKPWPLPAVEGSGAISWDSHSCSSSLPQHALPSPRRLRSQPQAPASLTQAAQAPRSLHQLVLARGGSQGEQPLCIWPQLQVCAAAARLIKQREGLGLANGAAVPRQAAALHVAHHPLPAGRRKGARRERPQGAGSNGSAGAWQVHGLVNIRHPTRMRLSSSGTSGSPSGRAPSHMSSAQQNMPQQNKPHLSPSLKQHTPR